MASSVRPWDFPGKSTGVGCHSKEQASFNFMAAVTICSDFGELGERLGAWWFEEQQRGAVGCSEVTGVGGRGRDRAGLVGGP